MNNAKEKLEKNQRKQWKIYVACGEQTHFADIIEAIAFRKIGTAALCVMTITAKYASEYQRPKKKKEIHSKRFSQDGGEITDKSVIVWMSLRFEPIHSFTKVNKCNGRTIEQSDNNRFDGENHDDEKNGHGQERETHSDSE